MKHLSKITIDSAKYFLRSGKSTRATSKALNIPTGAALRIRKKDLDNIPILKAGRPSKVTKTTKRHLAREFDTGRINTLQQGKRLIKAVKGVTVHQSTVDNYLKQEGLKTYVQSKKRGLTKDQKSARYTFARNHLDWTVND